MEAAAKKAETLRDQGKLTEARSVLQDELDQHKNEQTAEVAALMCDLANLFLEEVR